MPSSLVKSIEKLINTKVAAYNKLVSEKFDIDVKELEKLWNEASGTKEKKVPPASVAGTFAFCGLSVARPGLGSGGIGGSGGMIAAAAAAAAGDCRWLGESEVAP